MNNKEIINVAQREGERLYRVNNQLKAEIDVYITHEREAPSIKECRHAVLCIKTKTQKGKETDGYVVYDRLLNRIVNGVFFEDSESALYVAQLYNQGQGREDMSPNGLALGLIYPETK